MTGFLIFNTQVLSLNRNPFKIGRALVNHLVIQEPSISRFHAEICEKDSRYFIKDLDSTGGTFVNEQEIDEVVLTSGDSILIAQIALVFVQNAPQLDQKASDATGPLKLPGPDPSPTTPALKPKWRPPKTEE